MTGREFVMKQCYYTMPRIKFITMDVELQVTNSCCSMHSDILSRIN